MSKGEESNPVPFGGEVGRELDKIWKAIKADKIVGSPGVRVSRTTGGTFLKFTDAFPEAEEPPPPTPRPPNEWRISRQGAEMPFKIYTHIEEVYGGTRNRTGRTMFCMGPRGSAYHPSAPPSFFKSIGKLETSTQGPLANLYVPSPLTELFWKVSERPKGWFKVPENQPANWHGYVTQSSGGPVYHTWEEWLVVKGWTKGEILFPNDPTCKHVYATGSCGPEPRTLQHFFDSGIEHGYRWLMVADGPPSLGISKTWHGYHLTREGVRNFANEWHYGALVVPSEILGGDRLPITHTEEGEVLTHYMKTGPYGPEGLAWKPDPQGITAGQWQPTGPQSTPYYHWKFLRVPDTGTPKEGFSYLVFTVDADGNKIYPHGFDLILPENHIAAPWGAIAPR